MIALTGATGKIGSLVAQRLAGRGVDQALVGRDPSRLPDLPGALPRGPAAYADTAAMRSALAGCETLLLVSAGLSGRRPEEHASALDAAERAGVRRVVYVSLLGAARDATYVNARDHKVTEDDLAGRDLRWTVLRPGFYASMLPGLAGPDGVIRSPAGDGRVGAVTHDDIADVAVEVLLAPDRTFDSRVLEVGGPEALDLHQVAARLTTWSGHPHTYVEEDAEQALAWRQGLPGVDPEVAAAWVSWHLAIARGEVSALDDVVREVAGHPARPVEDAWGTDEPQALVR